MKRTERRNRKSTIGIILLFLTGLSILLYPTVSNLWNEHRDKQLISVYNAKVSKSGTNWKKEFAKARAYNRDLRPKSVPDAFSSKAGHRSAEYEKLLNVTGNGMMGYVDVPSIHVKLPVFHYTTKSVLKKGAGHLLGSSLPVGGKGTHAVISAHRGLPSAKMFTDLDQLKEGDQFYLYILNKVLAYQVDQIKVVKPTQTDALAAVKGKDYVTLLTCTPYGVNSHRLLVRGYRVPYNPAEKAGTHHNWKHMLMVLLCIAAGLAMAFVISKAIFWDSPKPRKE
ncbi:MAG: class C sortase [Hornefia butyriciproducens]|uniref:class C sortase n=1 Tax=Hornefia butyriciproducens TaxID=2652293 RepID=UPI002A74D99C|nr:class C sortase [Hornefia butyriciproducens]MCI7326505.1 class C sortase [Clostridiales bacterium]MDY2990393.1 class C sortase [Hornefia butyriciproducens]